MVAPEGLHSVLDAVRGLPNYRELWLWEHLHIGQPTLLEERALQDDPLGSRWNVRRTNAANPCGNLVLYRTELNHQRSYQDTSDMLRDRRDARSRPCDVTVWIGAGDFRDAQVQLQLLKLSQRMSSVLLAYHRKGKPGRFGQHTIGTTSLGGWREKILLLQANVHTPLDMLPVTTGRSICESLDDSYHLHRRSHPWTIVEGDLSRGSEPSNAVQPTIDIAQHGRRGRRCPTSETTLHVETPEPKAELPPKPQAELPPEPQAELPHEPQAELPHEPQAELPLEPQAELPPEPQAELPPEPQAELPPEPQAELPLEPQAESCHLSLSLS
ncbi:hypothetical protein H6P81_007262 [Aristolochia fimbriata]|uniref:Uncharacterized protein n=1 Tax=Aristolochia fimbriata TaxID=158543 RepID=A0AAV7EZW7_ARIFI|nr:hypothetical protein H6P81_007262 [Aristolochia fimbriata]